jgi:ATP adenylyltransferase
MAVRCRYSDEECKVQSARVTLQSAIRNPKSKIDPPGHPEVSEGPNPKSLLFAPWRTAYIQDKRPKGCFLCKAIKGKDDDQTLLLYRGRKAIVILNRFPYNNAHLMIAPHRHSGDFEELTPTEGQELFSLLQRALKALGRIYEPDGFNIGMNLGRVAGAGLADHLHIHIVPRWNGDTNFMPVISDTKVISEALARTYERLKRAF